MQQYPLLQTKLHIPPIRPELVSRPRLIERLNEGLRLGHRLTLISAPAGFGKTTVLSEWVAGAERPVAWLSLDENDGDLTRFLRYLHAALARAVPDLTAPPAGGTPPSFEAVLVPLINDLASLTTPLLLVLDDYHLVDNAAIDQALVFLLDNAPSSLHLVIATRAHPSFPLPRWRARQQLVEIREGDLRFTPAETAQFFEATSNLTLDAQDLSALNARAEGWIAALQLAAISLRGQQDVSSFVQAFGGSHRYILDYLVEEILQQQTPEVITFLLQTAILERFNAALCDAVLGTRETPAQQTLLQLERANLFLIPLDDERRWYRYHHLFRDFLRSRLETEQPDLVPVLHHQAAQWYAAAGLTDEAVHHALAAQDHDLAATLIANAYPDMLQRGEVVILKRWIDALPAAVRNSNPDLLLAHAWTCVVTLDVEELAGSLAELEHMVDTKTDLSPEDRAAVQGEMLTIHAARALQLGDVEGTIQYAEQALASLPAGEGALRCVAAHNLGNAYHFLGKIQPASAAFAQAVSEGRRAGNHFLAFSAIVSWGQLRRSQGQWRKAERMYREGLDWATAHQAQPLDGLVHVGLGLIEWDRWELALARHHLETGIELCRRTGAHTLEATAAGALARLAEQKGQREEAQSWLEKTLTLARSLHYTEAAGVADLVEAQCHMARSDRQALAQWLARWQPVDHPSLDLRLRGALVVGQAKLALGEPRGAMADLALVQEIAGPVSWTQRRVEGWVLEAQAHQTLGERPRALTKLGDALDLSWPEGFLRPFVQAGEPLHSLLQELAMDDATAEKRAFIETIGAALDLPREAPPVAALLVEPLTAREMEVLRLLPTDLTTAEIADRLVISYHTARTHLKNIYGKLDAHSRHHAVSRAKELDLL